MCRLLLIKWLILGFQGLLIFGLIQSCATRGAPGGGPLDRTPPYVVYSEPTRDSLGVDRSIDAITLGFSERMIEGSLQNNIYISPPMEFEMDWSDGRILRLNLPDTLKENQTYVVSVGSQAQDMRRNNMEQSYQFAFSTGDSIDRGQINGRVFDLQSGQIAHIFAYAAREDSLTDPTVEKPDYVSQTGAKGLYSLNYLKPNRYRVFAVTDQNFNQKLDGAYEKVGLPYADAKLDSGRLKVNQLNFHLTSLDTTAPELISVRSITDRELKVRLSEALPLQTGLLKRFTIQDSVTGENIPLFALSGDPESESTIRFFTATMDSGARYRLKTEYLEDPSGNKNDAVKPIYFKGSDNRDTTRFELSEFTPPDSSLRERPETAIKIVFSRPVRWQTVKKQFTLSDNSEHAVMGHWDIKDGFYARFVPEKRLTPDSAFRAKIDLNGIADVWGNEARDTVRSHYFKIISNRELGELSGRLSANAPINKPIQLDIFNASRKDVRFQHRMETDGEFYVKYLPEGRYLVDIYVDTNEDSVFSDGQLIPFEFAEPYFRMPDTVEVRQRWETQGVRLFVPLMK